MNYYYKWTDVIQSLLIEMKRLWMFFAEYRRCMVNISYTLGNISLEVENVSVELTQNLLKDTTFLPY